MMIKYAHEFTQIVSD